ncbi:MAG TPA: methyltransferase domain-containing protein [Alphaproteobacteria bacterium]|nr:methyltransferase domain-containing protein [Alphaproteobacteria bacterium]
MNRTLKVAKAFSRAEESYNEHALVQNFAAQRLATKILAQEGPTLGTLLEVGCGTGMLSRHLVSHAKHYVLTDFSFALLQKAHKQVRGGHVFPLVVDGEHPCFSASFDVIVSNLALHWFQDPKRALVRLVACLKPGGRLYLTTLGNNTFHEWRTAHSLADAPCGILDFITFGQLKDWLPLSGIRTVEEEWVTTTPANALEFLRSLKAIGGRLPQPGHRPLPHKTFKKVMDTYNLNPKSSCQILYGTYQKPEKIREE